MKYYIVAGEASGDLMGSYLMKGLYQMDKDALIRFYGGNNMENVYRLHNRVANQGGGKVRDYAENAIMGIWEIVIKARQLIKTIKDCQNDILAWKPDALILVDYPGFNMKLAEFAFKNSIKTFYYIAPKTWASREGRNEKLKKYIEHLYLIFPFEVPYFEGQGIPCSYFGNPLVTKIDNFKNKNLLSNDFFTALKIERCSYIAFLAGSRKSEISRMMPMCAKISDWIKGDKELKNYKIIVAMAPRIDRNEYEKYIEGKDNVVLAKDLTYPTLLHSQAAIINSGTASLEAALLGTPQVVCWSTSSFSYFIAKYLWRVGKHISYISLGNLIVNKLVFKELIQSDFNVENVICEVRNLLTDKEYRKQMLEGYREIRTKIDDKDASVKIASSIIDKLNGVK